MAFITFVSGTTDSSFDFLLGLFAIEVTKTNCAHKICKVSFEHLGTYQVVTKDFFALFDQKNNFVDLYKNRNLDVICSKIANDLFEMFCGLNMVPMLRQQEGGDDEITNKIGQKMVDLFKSCDEQQKKAFSKTRRPLLVLFNRKLDI